MSWRFAVTSVFVGVVVTTIDPSAAQAEALGAPATDAVLGAPRAPRKPLPLPGVTRWSLDNGLTVLWVPDATVPWVQFELGLEVGRYDDPAGMAGMSKVLVESLKTGGGVFLENRFQAFSWRLGPL